MKNRFCLIGDAHLGKTFKSKDIPLEMKGKREKLLRERFETLIDKGMRECCIGTSPIEGIIQLGDLFDSPNVDYDTLLYTYKLLVEVENNEVPCYILAGNHDLSKEMNRESAIEILAKMFRKSEHIKFVIDHPVIIHGDILLVPYNHFKTIEEQVEEYCHKARIVCGHFNVEEFAYLSERFEKVYTGHIHSPSSVGNVTVIGAIMPLTFGEDPDNSFMKTCTLEDYERDVAEGTSEGRCYRIKLKEGEELPLEKKCLQMSVYKDKPEELKDIDVNFETFDFEKIMKEDIKDPDLFEELFSLYQQLRLEEANNV